MHAGKRAREQLIQLGGFLVYPHKIPQEPFCKKFPHKAETPFREAGQLSEEWAKTSLVGTTQGATFLEGQGVLVRRCITSESVSHVINTVIPNIVLNP